MTDRNKTVKKFIAATEAATVAMEEATIVFREWARAWSALPPEVLKALREADS